MSTCLTTNTWNDSILGGRGPTSRNSALFAESSWPSSSASINKKMMMNKEKIIIMIEDSIKNAI
jgi:hypothetical protein